MPPPIWMPPLLLFALACKVPWVAPAGVRAWHAGNTPACGRELLSACLMEVVRVPIVLPRGYPRRHSLAAGIEHFAAQRGG
ncbi:hypothetical protein [Luteimonas kalidii]|uniref:Secreted protein n=1 Tax=Luteimonas kalidii TaxID=3042025 RepID=A0ABT6JUP0_9GAMM|nr:hypothetical protein [Luteimonas kalidii]MDH5834413.1 hypothetical protein [Luteimonas kalidii]